MQRIPAESQRELVQAQLAGVEDAVKLDVIEHRTAERLELVGPVLAQVDGVVGPLGASVNTFGVDTYTAPPGRSSERKWRSTASGSGTCSIVCRNTIASQGSA
jgi:hypothetical protein